MNEECRLAEAALAALTPDDARDSSPDILWPPVAERIRLAREQSGATQAEVAARAGFSAPSLYWDLELRDDEAFTCVSVVELHSIASVLGTTGSQLLFGEDLGPPPEAHDFTTIAHLLRGQLDAESLTPDALGERIGWDIQNILADPGAVGELNIVGLRDVCKAVGVDWIGAFLAAGRRRPTRG